LAGWCEKRWDSRLRIAAQGCARNRPKPARKMSAQQEKSPLARRYRRLT
jgi:hypothetical protein